MTRGEAFAGFKPSFITAVLGQLRDLFEGAYAAATASIAITETDDKITKEGIFTPPTPTGDRFLNFGHVPTGGGSGVRSECLPYRLTIDFDGDDLDSVELTLFLLNPRFALARSGFVPATFDQASGQVAIVASPSAPPALGLELVADPPGTTTFDHLKRDVPAAALGSNPPGFDDYSMATLLDRLDVVLKWPREGIVGRALDTFGKSLAIPDTRFPKDITSHELRLYSPGVLLPFDALLHESKRIVIVVAKSIGASIELVTSPPSKPADTAPSGEQKRWKRFQRLRQEFGLPGDFKGLVFDGLAAHLLDDEMRGHSSVEVKVGASAVALSGATTETQSETSKWYTSVELTVTNAGRPLFGVLEQQATLAVSIAQGGMRHVALSGTFADAAALGPAMGWLAQKSAVVSLARYPWKDSVGNAQVEWALELGLVGSEDRVLAVVDASTAGGQAELDALLTALAFGPLVLVTDPLDVDVTVPAPDAKTRGYFAELHADGTWIALFTVSDFGGVFKKAIAGRELRITAAYLRDQPRRINDKTADAAARETALLFDYEADYHVKFDDSGIATTRPVSTRVQGSGFAAGGRGFRWVQVPNGIYELSLDDPGLWDLTGIGKLLRIVSVAIRKRNGKTELVIRLRLAGNFGIVKADDFVFVLDVKGNAGLEAYPSAVEIDIPSAVKAKGKLVIGEATTGGGKKISGSLDLTIVPIKLRIFAALRLDTIVGSGKSETALLASAAVDFPKPLPLGTSGLGISRLEGLYATHFERVEKAQVGAVPPALQWLADAEGKVAESVDNDALWKPAYDRWSFGLGLTTGLMAGAKLVNLNGVFVLELPGPRVLVFCKVNVLKNPRTNEEAPDDLIKGILGLLQIDFARNELVLGALADLEFQKVVKVRAAMELFFHLRQLSKWHFFLGTFEAPVTAKLDVGEIIKVSGELYFMAAGEGLTGEHWPSGSLPGFALAFGQHAFARIGGDDLYLQVDLRADLGVSLSKQLYLFGRVGLSGELNLWIVSIGASGYFDLEFLKTNPDPPNQVWGKGGVCGEVKTFLFTLKGCVSIEFGSEIEHEAELPELIQEVSLVSGIDVAKFGQGADGAIDAKVGTATPGTTTGTEALNIPIDSVIAIGMSAPPRASGPLFTGTGGDAPNAGSYNFGGVTGHYVITNITLTPPGALTASTPWRWWRNPTPASGGQPAPVELALFTRNPFGPSNALPASDVLDAWLDAIAKNPCSDVPPPQPCLYHFTAADVGTGDGGVWVRPGTLCSAALEREIGRNGVSELHVEAAQPYGLPPDLAGLPLRAGRCVPEVASGVVSHVLKLTAILLASQQTEPVPLTARFTTDGLSRRTPLQILAAFPAEIYDETIGLWFRIVARSGAQVVASGKAFPLSASAREEFHRNCPLWRPVTEAFAELAVEPRFGDLRFHRIDLDLSSLPESDPPVGFMIAFNASADHFGARETVLVGAVKCTPLAEEARAAAQHAAKDQLIDDIEDLFQSNEVPLLEPDTQYTLAVQYDKRSGGTTTAIRDFTFHTAKHPPRRLDPYLLAAFPTPDEQFHFTRDTPGLILASNLILRVLAQHEAWLRVTITNDGEQPVHDSSGAVHWDKGAMFDPAVLADLQQTPPPGIERKPVPSIPSAIKQALQEKQAAGGLACVPDLVLPESALWLGFDVQLRPLTGYAIQIDVVKPNGELWSWPDGIPDGTVQPFFASRFRTSLYESAEAHARVLNRLVLRHRLLAAGLQVPAGEADAGAPALELIADKALEDAVAVATGERSSRSGDPLMTVLWMERSNVLKPTAVLVESNEPLIRRALLPAVVPLDGGAYRVTDATLQLFSWPRLDGVAGASRVVMASSGFALLLLLDETVAGPLTITLADAALDRLPRTLASPAPAVTLTSALIAGRRGTAG